MNTTKDIIIQPLIVSRMRSEFLRRLPQRIKDAVNPDHLFNLDISNVKGLLQGEKDYYEGQFSMLKSFEEVEYLDSSVEDKESNCCTEKTQHGRALRISTCANFFLLALKIYAVVKTGSLAITVSTLDSTLDFVAGLILWISHLFIKSVNFYKYPIGKQRVQPVGILIFASIMATIGFMALLESLEQLIKNEPFTVMSSNQLLWLNIIMLFATVVKLILWLYCRSSTNELVRAFAKDHYFDVVTNLLGMIAADVGDKMYWWVDPVGAIALAIYTIINWSGSVLENAVSLVGRAAPPQLLQKLTYLVMTHHHNVKRVHAVRAYTSGVCYFVEVVIEIPEDLPLKEAHVIVESLGIKMKLLPEVERAFILTCTI